MAVILIVDDDPTVRLIATELLRGDHAVVEAGDGDEALKLVAAMPVDLVVLDMLMPNRDGLETIVALRKTRPNIRILAISSGGRMEPGQLLRTAMVFGADDCLEKPLRVSTFGAAVQRLLSAPKTAASPWSATTR